ncbi:hypothetical protein [Gillisia marina]|uniref:hypothetical protein n=1 Tax=Gillisia marina TaxID=1167637 RepID=UPI00029A851D|nr:hypothetical protein [Gillisia marina]
MIQKTTLFFTTILMTFNCLGQEEIQLADKNDVQISYQLLLEEEGKKKDKYILIVNAINESETDLYYEVPLTENSQGELQLPFIPEDKGFTKILVRNSTGLFGDGQSIIGDQTDLMTTDNSLLFHVKKGEILTQETTFKVKTGVDPLITNTFNKSLKPLENFDIMVTGDMLDGDYISSCGNFNMNLKGENSIERGDYLLQTTNGNQFIWIRTSETTFVRENSDDFALTFNKDESTFKYSTSDGINCTWSKP